MWSFWDMRHIQGYEIDSGGEPFHSHLWFLRDLIVMTFFSPFFYYLLKYLRVFAILLALLLWLFFPFDIFYFMRNESILFFLIGGFLQLYSINILSYKKFM